jgi:hypothetical protein
MKPSDTTSPTDENHRHPSTDDVPDVDPSSVVKKKKKKKDRSAHKSSSSSNRKTAKPLQPLQGPESPAHSDDAIPPPPTTSPPSIPLERGGGSSAIEQQPSSTSRLRESQPLDTLAPADRDIPSNGPTSPASSGVERRGRGSHQDDKDVDRGHEGSHSRSGSTRERFSTKILLCGGSERESKRKDLQDENNPLSSNPPASSPDSSSCVRGRKSSRKGSKKKSKEVIPLSTIEDKTARATEEGEVTEGEGIEDSQQEGEEKEAPKHPNKSCCFCWCCCCSCSW